MFYLLFSASLVFGLLVGSFLNVVILRFHTGRSWFGGRSECLTCNKTLSWRELMPLISFLWQRGKCVHCRAKLSVQYPLVEIGTAALFGLSFWHVGIPQTALGGSTLVYLWIMSALFVLIAVYDMRHKIIPNAFVYPLIILSLFSFVAFHIDAYTDSIWLVFDVLAGPVLALPLALFWFVSQGRWMGLGDAKLMVGIGWFLGMWQGLAAFVFAFWIGALFGIALIGISKLRTLFSSGKPFTIKSEIPFGPFIILGALTVFFLELNIFTVALLFL